MCLCELSIKWGVSHRFGEPLSPLPRKKSVAFLAGHGEICHPHGWCTCNTPVHMDFLYVFLNKAPSPCGLACCGLVCGLPCGSPMWGANFAMACQKSHWKRDRSKIQAVCEKRVRERGPSRPTHIAKTGSTLPLGIPISQTKSSDYTPARNYCETNSENIISCIWNEIFQAKSSKNIWPLNSLNRKRIRVM